MNAWTDFNKYRETFSSLMWWDENKLLFFHKFKFPIKCKDLLIVVGRTGKVSFALEKVLRILELVKGVSIYLLIEKPGDYEELIRLEGEHPGGNTISIPALNTPLSISIQSLITDKKIPAISDCSIILAPYTGFDSMIYISQLPLADYLKTISKTLLTLDNRNLLSQYPDPLDDVRKLNGNTIYGYASLSNEDMQLIYKYATESAGGMTVEIGRFLGGSTSIIALANKESGGKTEFHSFDPILPDIVPKILKRNAVEDYVDLHKMNSREAFSKWESISQGNKIDFLFIDGDHSYDGIVFDFTNWGNLVKKGGLIIAHDYCNFMDSGLVDVDIAIHKHLLNGEFDVIDHCFTTIVCRKR